VGLASGKVASGPDEALVGIRNDTWVTIARIHAAPPNGSHRWGPDLLAGATIANGDSIAVTLSCQTRDYQFVDEFGHSCVTEELDVCVDNPIGLDPQYRLPGVFATWRLTPIRRRDRFTQGRCAGFGRPMRGFGRRHLLAIPRP
jgi:hypothetical protein